MNNGEGGFQNAFQKAIEIMESSDGNEARIECEVCKRIFMKRHHFNLHQCDKKVKNVPCEVCQKRFPTMYRLREHLRVHSGEKPFQCDVCKRCFSQKAYLTRHLLVHSQDKPFKCNLCDKSYTQSAALKEHTYTHTGERPLKCHHCDRCFSSRTAFNVHVSIHENDKMHECTICQKLFSQRSYLLRHLSTHKSQKAFKCDFCDKSFNLRSSLREHRHTHTGQKPYKCEQCGKLFSHKITMFIHIEQHHEDDAKKLLKCQVCDKRFLYKSLLKRHVSRAHKYIKCVLCDKQPKHCVCLEEHLDAKVNSDEKPIETQSHQNSSGRNIPCYFCRKAFCSKIMFEAHMKQHKHIKLVVEKSGKFFCNICQRKYKCIDTFYRHFRTHDNKLVNVDIITKLHECKICLKQYKQRHSAREHLLTHLFPKRFDCHVCQKSFCHRNSFMKHVTTHGNENLTQSFLSHIQLQPDFFNSNNMFIKCLVCKRQFFCKADLHRHMKTHTKTNGVKQYWFQCAVCEQKFKYKIHFQRHFQSHKHLKCSNSNCLKEECICLPVVKTEKNEDTDDEGDLNTGIVHPIFVKTEIASETSSSFVTQPSTLIPPTQSEVTEETVMAHVFKIKEEICEFSNSQM